MKKIKITNATYITDDAMHRVICTLNASELRLYLYLVAKSQELRCEEFPLNRSECVDFCGFSMASYQRALKGLQQKNYLHKLKNGQYALNALGYKCS